MAFTLTSAAYSGRYMQLSLTQTKNVEANTSTISWTLIVTGGSSNYYSTGPTTVTVNGQQVYYCARKSHTTCKFPAAKGSVSGSLTVAHNDDGSCTVPVSLATAIYDSDVATVSGSWTLDTIPRASTIGATAANIGEVSTVSVVRQSTGYSHSIAYRFGSLSGYLTAGGGVSAQEVKFTNTGVPFEIPTDFYAQIPNSPTGTCTLTCRTYSGSTQIGSAQSCSFTVTASQSECAPEVSGTVVDCNEATLALTGDEAVLVRYMSDALCTITAQTKNGAGSITSRQVNGTAVAGSSAVLSGVETGTITFTATDSRGYPGSCPVTPTMIPYVRLTNNAAIRRTDPTSGNAELTVKGQSYAGTFGAVDNYRRLSYSINGAEAVEVDLPMDQTDYELVISLEGLDYQQSHSITVTVSDALDAVEKTVTLGKGVPVFDWGENDFMFHVPVTFGGGISGPVSGAYIRSVRLSASKVITVQSKLTAFSSDSTTRQGIFLFGNDNGALIYGVVGLRGWGTGEWSGAGDVQVEGTTDGQFQITLPYLAYDFFTLISPEPFSIIT